MGNSHPLLPLAGGRSFIGYTMRVLLNNSRRVGGRPRLATKQAIATGADDAINYKGGDSQIEKKSIKTGKTNLHLCRLNKSVIRREVCVLFPLAE